MAEKEKTFEIRDMDLYYGNFQALKKVNIDIYKKILLLDRTVRMWKIHFPALSEPDE